MRTCCLLAALALTLSPGAAQEPPLPPANPAPALVLDPGGPAAPVVTLTFSPDSSTLYAGGPVLVTAGREWTADGKQVSAVRVFDVTTGKELGSRTDLPATDTIPGLAAWPAGGGVRVAVAWPNPGNAAGKLLLWDPAANQ